MFFRELFLRNSILNDFPYTDVLFNYQDNLVYKWYISNEASQLRKASRLIVYPKILTNLADNEHYSPSNAAAINTIKIFVTIFSRFFFIAGVVLYFWAVPFLLVWLFALQRLQYELEALKNNGRLFALSCWPPILNIHCQKIWVSALVGAWTRWRKTGNSQRTLQPIPPQVIYLVDNCDGCKNLWILHYVPGRVSCRSMKEQLSKMFWVFKSIPITPLSLIHILYPWSDIQRNLFCLQRICSMQGRQIYPLSSASL